jgi:hypothetical protein
MKFTHVKFVYFKHEGKYYSEGDHDFEGQVPFHECLSKIREMLVQGKRPGLVDGHGFHTLVTVYTEFGPLPHLFARNGKNELI